MSYISQSIMLYTLNLYSAVCQLYFNKMEGKKKTFEHIPKSLVASLWGFKPGIDMLTLRSGKAHSGCNSEKGSEQGKTGGSEIR